MARRGLRKLLRKSVPHFCRKIYRQSLVRNPFFCLESLLVRPWRYHVAPSAGEPYVVHIWYAPWVLCHPMCTHSVVGFQRSKQYSKQQSIGVNSFQVGRSVLLHRIYSWDFFLFQNSGQVGTLGTYSISLTTNEQHARYYYVPGSKRSNAFWGDLRHTLTFANKRVIRLSAGRCCARSTAYVSAMVTLGVPLQE